MNLICVSYALPNWKFLCSLNGPIAPLPQSCWQLNLEWLPCIEHIVQSLQVTFKSFWCQFLHPHLSTYYPNIDVQIIAVFNLGMSTSSYALSNTRCLGKGMGMCICMTPWDDTCHDTSWVVKYGRISIEPRMLTTYWTYSPIFKNTRLFRNVYIIVVLNSSMPTLGYAPSNTQSMDMDMWMTPWDDP